MPLGIFCSPVSCRFGQRSPDPPIETWLPVTVLAVLWLNANANGQTTFLWVRQLFSSHLFFGQAAVLISNSLHSAVGNTFSVITVAVC